MPPAESPDSDAQLARLNESLATLQAAAEADENSGSGPRETSPEETLSRSPGAAKDPESGSGRSRVEPHIAEPISYWELPQGVRDNLPDFNITVMVYADNPADRFLLIDGDRLVEKEEWDSGVVLDEIRRDGAIFKYRKYRFLVKG
jgi:general secretion pathway protein B